MHKHTCIVAVVTFQQEGIIITKNLIKFLKTYPKPGWKYEDLDKDTLDIIVFQMDHLMVISTDHPKVGFTIFRFDKEKHVSLIDLISVKSRIIFRTTLEAETFTLADAYDSANEIQHGLRQIIKRKWEINILTNMETLFAIIIRITSTTKSRLITDM